jgi:ATP-dependent Lon protease
MIRVLSKQFPRQSVGKMVGETSSSTRKLSSYSMNHVSRHPTSPITSRQSIPAAFHTSDYYYFYNTGSTRQSTLQAQVVSDPGRIRTFFTSSNSDSEKDNGKDSKKNENGVEGKKEDKDDASSDVVTPTVLPFGESAPRLPHMIALPLVSRPLFPGLITAVTLTDSATINAFEELHTKGNSFLSCFLRAKYSSGVASETGTVLETPELITDISDLHTVGTFAQIQRLTRDLQNPKPTDLSSSNDKDGKSGGTANNTATLILLAHRRVDLLSVDSIGPPIDVTVKHWARMEYTGTGSDDSIRALRNEIISTIREVAQMNALFRENLQLFPIKLDVNDPFRLADFAASISSSGTPEDLQDVFAERNAEIRLHKALVLLIREREVSKLQKEISRKVDERMSEEQRTYFLKEQLKSIKKELGMERDDKDTVIEKYRNTLNAYPQPIPPDASAAIEAEIDKLSNFGMNSPDAVTIRSYLDWLTSIPWNVMTPENYNISAARKALDHDHYGIEDVKTAILQFVAVGKLKQKQQQQGINVTNDENATEKSKSNANAAKIDTSTSSSAGKILCLAGPPGTGKTSIASSIANALGRKFYRFSVGGLSDVSEIKGHRR